MTIAFPATSWAARRTRVVGVVYRDLTSLRHNPPRLVEAVFWPTTEVVQWGLLSLFLNAYEVPTAVAVLLGALLLWQIIVRAQTDMSVAFLEDIWSRNIVNVFVTPLTTGEYLIGLLVVGMLKVTANTVLMATLAFLLYGFGLLTIGPGLVPFMAVLLVMGWALGAFAIATMIRFGPGVQTLSWMLSFMFLPFSAVFYPLAVLPGPMQAIAHAVPASYVFEGMRAVIAGQGISWPSLVIAAALDAVYVVAALLYLGWAIRHSRQSGRLSRFSE